MPNISLMRHQTSMNLTKQMLLVSYTIAILSFFFWVITGDYLIFGMGMALWGIISGFAIVNDHTIIGCMLGIQGSLLLFIYLKLAQSGF